MGIRNLFKREEIKRLNDKELREFYLESKIAEKKRYVLTMIMSIVITIALTSLSISLKKYWILAGSIIFLIGFILNMVRYGKLIENIFENKIIEGEDGA